MVEALEARYSGSPGMLEMYQRKLLIPGWCGAADRVEWEYVAQKLREDTRLRGLWKKAGYDRGAILRRKRFPKRQPGLLFPLRGRKTASC